MSPEVELLANTSCADCWNLRWKRMFSCFIALRPHRFGDDRSLLVRVMVADLPFGVTRLFAEKPQLVLSAH